MRYSVLATLLLLTACTGSPPATTPPAETDTPPAAPPQTPPTPTAPPEVPWRAVWTVDGGSVVDEIPEPDGRLLAPTGSTPAGEASPCGEAHRYGTRAMLWLPPGEPITFLKAPMVSAALVERASWRLAEVAPDTQAIAPGVDSPDPALHQGIRVRSVRKIRRQGAPFQIVLGERGTDVLIAITDRDAKKRMGGLRLERSSDAPMRFGVIPPADIDGDGKTEFVIYGDGESGGFRAVLEINLVTGRTTERWFEESPPRPACH